MVQSHGHARTDAGVAGRGLRNEREYVATAEGGAVMLFGSGQAFEVLLIVIEIVNRSRYSRVPDVSGEGRANARRGFLETPQKFVVRLLKVDGRWIFGQEQSKRIAKHGFVHCQKIRLNEVRLCE